MIARSFKVVGLTGGIGSGKSEVARLFNQLGIPSLDADQVSKKLREPGEPGFLAIQALFGTTEAIKIREIISQDSNAKQELEKIMHPMIAEQSEKLFKSIHLQNSKAPFILYEASLLIEAKRSDDFNALIVVTAPMVDRVKRIMNRDQISPELAKLMISAQLTDEERLTYATHHILNDGNFEKLKQETEKTLEQIKMTC